MRTLYNLVGPGGDDASRRSDNRWRLAIENRLLRHAELRPGEPLEEVSSLAVIYDPEVDAYSLQLLADGEESPVAEYWFGTCEQAERQATQLFGARFAGWADAGG